MHPDSPHHRYFRATEGRWRGNIRFDITDPKGLRASPLRLVDRWSVWSMAVVSRRLSSLVLSTTMEPSGRERPNEVLHTTRMSNFGLTMFRSRETLLLADDGLSFRLTGAQAFFPRLWKATEWSAHGAVAADHDGAVYHMPFFGVSMEQHTRLTPDGLEVTQTTPFSRTHILLRRQRPMTAAPGTSRVSEGGAG